MDASNPCNTCGWEKIPYGQDGEFPQCGNCFGQEIAIQQCLVWNSTISSHFTRHCICGNHRSDHDLKI